MTTTVAGLLFSVDGDASSRVAVQGATGPETRMRGWRSPAADVRAAQDPEILVDLEHDGRWIGHVAHLERRAAGVWCVAVIDGEPVVPVRVGEETVELQASWYFSAKHWQDERDGGLLLHSVALTTKPARHGARPVTFWPGDLNLRGGWTATEIERGLLERAYEARLRRRRGEPIRVDQERRADLDHRSLSPAEVMELNEDAAWKNRPLRKGPRGRVIAVR